MAERSSLNQIVQIGVETTPGTSVAASKRLQSIGIEPSPSVEMDQFRPAGQKYRAITTLGKEWSEAPITGRGSYTEIIYMLSSVLTTGVITTPAGATLARQWAFTPNSTDDDTPTTFTIEHGSSIRASKFTYGLVTEFGMTFNRDAIEVSGSLMGKAITDNITLTAAPTTINLVPIVPTQVSVYLDSTSAALGTTKLTRAISADFNLGNRFGPVWVLDAANPSFVNHIETEPDLTCSLLLQADTQGMAQLDQMRSGATKFLRIEAVGAEIDTGIATSKYRFTLDMAVKVVDLPGFDDADGVFAVECNFVGVHDGGWGKALQVAVVNELTAL